MLDPSVLRAALTDAREFLSSVRFARPALLWLTLLPVAVAVVRWAAGRRRRARVAALGRPGSVAALHARPRRGAWLAGVAMFFAWALLVLGVAGPRWGKGEDGGVAVGRDVVIVLDVSRSTWAEDMASAAAPERWQAAVAGAQDLVAAARRAGGHRVGVVIFAARPKVLVPLTTDYDHVRLKLAELDARTPPPEVRPADDAAGSGTRIGAALAAAVDAHDPRFPGYQDIVLITDADDPAGDEEWRRGVAAARKANIPVHVVGVGDPARESFILKGGEPLEAPGPGGAPAPIQTRLHEDVAQAIAAEGRGAYLPARREVPRLGEFFRTRIEPFPTKELSDDLLPQPRERYAWFLGPAAALLVLAWLQRR